MDTSSTKHYSQEKEDRTRALLDRVLKILTGCKSSIRLNGKDYKKINFSHSQVINALNEFATFDEKNDGIVISNASTISKNETYKAMISEAKIARKELETENKGSGLTGDVSLDYAHLKDDYEALRYKYKIIEHKNKCLEQIVKDSEEVNSENEGLHKTVQLEEKSKHELVLPGPNYKKILEILLKGLYEDMLVMVDAPQGNRPASLHHITIAGNSTRICKLDDLKDLNVDELQKDIKRWVK